MQYVEHSLSWNSLVKRIFQVFCALANSIAAQNYLNATHLARGGRKVPTDLAGYVEICNNNAGLVICNSNGDYTALDSNGNQVTDTICDATGTIVTKFKINRQTWT